uniref:Disease resistance protein winged helix domain-containing protein n=1 Tax=Oryza brachyantha TaxID=4533 RepID=J3MR67_ORYBR
MITQKDFFFKMSIWIPGWLMKKSQLKYYKSVEFFRSNTRVIHLVFTIASLLDCQPKIMQEWDRILNFLGSTFGGNPSLESMRQILNLSYKNHPLRRRTCLLYLRKCQEDYSINRDHVDRQWITVGFVRCRSYFNELISRLLIQPVQNDYMYSWGCRVHDMMLDLILSRCKEENFIIFATVVKRNTSMGKPRGYSCNKLHRLSLQSKAAESDCTMLTEGREVPAHLAQI